MKCPGCESELTEKTAGAIKVDVCHEGCGGVWFDKDELKKVDSKHEVDAEVILNVERDPSIHADREKIRFCPKCDDEELCIRWFDIKNQVEIDQCLHCSGIWLDTGELLTVRSQHATDADRQKAADAYLAAHLHDAKKAFKDVSVRRIAEWEQEISLPGTLKRLFRGLL